jgi:hypothetical protein
MVDVSELRLVAGTAANGKPTIKAHKNENYRTVMSALGPDCVKTRGLRLAGMDPILCPDRLHQTTNAQNAHDPFHVVGQDV